MCTKLSHYPFPVIYPKHYTDSSTSLEQAKSTLHMLVPPSSMDRRSNFQTRWTQQRISRIKKPTLFNRCASLFCIMPLPSITLFSLHSAIFPQINPKPQQTLQNRWLSSFLFSSCPQWKSITPGCGIYLPGFDTSFPLSPHFPPYSFFFPPLCYLFNIHMYIYISASSYFCLTLLLNLLATPWLFP